MDQQITDLGEYKLKKFLLDRGMLREYSDKYEFCMVEEYESLYPQFSLHSIGIGDIFLQIVERNGKYKLVSYEFSKEAFNVTDIALWMNTYQAKIYQEIKNNRVRVQGVNEIIDALKFKGNVVVLFEVGTDNENLEVEDLLEVTKAFVPSIYKRDTSFSKEVENSNKTSKIIVNNDEVNHIPRIELDPSKDLVLCNGNIIVADYIDDYQDFVGFYSYNDHLIPLSWIHDTQTNIFIDIYEREKGKLINIEYKYAIDLKSLLDLLD